MYHIKPGGRNMGTDTARVNIGESMDVETITVFSKEMNRHIEKGAKKIVCDFSETEYISSMGISAIMVAYKKIKKNGGELVLSSLKPRVMDIFISTGLTQILSIE
jgi:anti-anti-sigma factor